MGSIARRRRPQRPLVGPFPLAGLGGRRGDRRRCFFFFSSRRRHRRLQGDWSSDVCSSDLVSGGVVNENGLDIPGLLAHTAGRKPVSEWKAGKPISNEQLWTIPCDWLVPAARGSVITREANARTVDCKVVVEGANEPTPPTADLILEERGIPVIPDFLANAGGVTVSYYEWAQNLQQYRWTHEQVNRELQATITKAYVG